VSNPAGSVLSAEAKLTVAAAPEITNQPISLGVTIGSPATFSVTAIGAAPLTYQWQRDGTSIAGRTGSTLVLTNVQSGDSAGYRVVVTNGAGSVTSVTATLSVTSTALPPTIVSQPESQAKGLGSNVTFRVGVSGTSPFSFQWRKNGASIAGATSDTLILPGVSLANAANYTVLVSNSQGSVTSGVATLTIVTPPTITTPPSDQSIAQGATTAFTVVAAGSPTLTYQWFKDGNPIAGATNTILPLDAVTDSDAGSYWVTVANGAGPATSRVATLIVSGAGSRLSNLSVRTTAGAGSQTLIVGFVVAGPGGKPVLVRGIGPSLAAFGVTGALNDPQLTLFRGTIQVATNDNWGDPPAGEQITSAAHRLGAFALAPTSRDSALLSTLQPDSYTAQLVATGASGIALIELYDGDGDLPGRIINVSARCQVGTGANILIAGFFIAGNAPKTVLLRGVGPTLAAFGVSDSLANPQMVLLRGSEIVATNDDWFLTGGASALPPVFAAAGAFPLAPSSRDAALVATLQPGSYTLQVSGAGNTTGVALVEIYEVP
jgi:hypothetical protein